MSVVEIIEWRPGCNKVEHTKLIKSSVGLDLAAAKKITDAVLAGHNPTVELETEVAAKKLIFDLDAIGFGARLI
jgi:hypothetical protein